MVRSERLKEDNNSDEFKKWVGFRRKTKNMRFLGITRYEEGVPMGMKGNQRDGTGRKT